MSGQILYPKKIGWNISNVLTLICLDFIVISPPYPILFGSHRWPGVGRAHGLTRLLGLDSDVTMQHCSLGTRSNACIVTEGEVLREGVAKKMIS